MKNNEITNIVQGVCKSLSGIREEAVANEITSVTVEIKTKDGKTTKQTIRGIDIRSRLNILQTIGNCIGFPAATDADFATVRSVMNKPGPILKDYLAGKLDWFFKGNPRYRATFFEMKNDKMYLKFPGTWSNKDKFYAVGKRRARFELEISICDYLQKEKEKQKKK